MKVATILPAMIVSEKAESKGCKLEGRQADGTLLWDYASCRSAGESKKLSFRSAMDFATTESLPEGTLSSVLKKLYLISQLSPVIF